MKTVVLAEGLWVDEPDPDRAPLTEALEQAGIEAVWRAWNDPQADWDHVAVCYPRATWDYYREEAAFRAWIEKAAHALRNPADVISWNLHKGYLVELYEAGIPVVPTVLVPAGDVQTLRPICEARGWGRVVIKPAVSCGSWETYTIGAEEGGEPMWTRLVAERDMLVQPFVTSVDTTGERCAIVIDDEVTHVIRKHPRFHGGVQRVDGPHRPTGEERSLIDRVIARVPAELDYARVDMVTDESGALMLAELELIEPSLFFPESPQALERFVAMIARRLA